MVILRVLSVGRLRGMNLLPTLFRKFIEILNMEMQWISPHRYHHHHYHRHHHFFMCPLDTSLTHFYFLPVFGGFVSFQFVKLASVDNKQRREEGILTWFYLCVYLSSVLFQAYFLKAFFSFRPNLSRLFYLQQKTYDHFASLHTSESECELWLSRTKLWITVYVVRGGEVWHHLAQMKERNLPLHLSWWTTESVQLQFKSLIKQ